MPFTALVVDDEPLARDELKYLLSSHRGCRVIGEAEDAHEALRLVAELQPDVVFLDIEMRGLSGCEAAKEMLGLPRKPLVIFATAYNEYAVRAFELGAVDYLLKPVEDKRLSKTIERITNLQQHSDDWDDAVERVVTMLTNQNSQIRKLPVEKKGCIRLVDFREIVFCQAREGDVQVFSHGDHYLYTGTMAELEARVAGDTFLRVHKSYLVNLNHVEGVLPWFKGTYWLIMGNPEQARIPVSKSRVKDLKSKLGLERS